MNLLVDRDSWGFWDTVFVYYENYNHVLLAYKCCHNLELKIRYHPFDPIRNRSCGFQACRVC